MCVNPTVYAIMGKPYIDTVNGAWPDPRPLPGIHKWMRDTVLETRTKTDLNQIKIITGKVI